MVYVCGVCNVNVPNLSSLRTHIRFLHTNSILSSFKCGHCPRSYSSLRSLCDHVQKQHIEAEVNPHEPDNDAEHDDINNNENIQGEQPDNNMQVEPVDNLFRGYLQPNVLEFKSNLFQSSLALSAKLYAETTFNRKQIQGIIEHISDFTASGFLDVLKHKVILLLGNEQDVEVQNVSEMFDALQDSFVGLKTEKQRMKALQESESFIRPETYRISQTEKVKYVNGNPVLTPVELTGQYISIKKVLKQFFELPSVLSKTLRNIENLKNSEKFTNIIQGPMWKNIEENHFQGKIVMPLFLYVDDCEPDNQTGAHSGCNSLTAVYYEVACIPQHLLSLLENIFVAALFLSSNKHVEDEAAFQPILDDLLDLEADGIHVVTDDGEFPIYFALALILGDNLGVHGATGFVEYFSANYFCRFCVEHRDVTRRETRENMQMLRNIENYNEHLEINDYSLTGIKRECIWNRLNSYHVVINLYLDFLHDFCEGVCHYDLCPILSELIRLQFFTLDTLNERIQHFDYGFDSGNKVTKITADHLRNEKLKMSGSEMFYFVSNLGLMIGDLVPHDNEIWQLYLSLAEIIGIIAAPYVRRGIAPYFATLIAEHHETYFELFQKPYRPKYHLMVHYPRVMEVIGPLLHVWTMRMEGNHRKVVKQNARSHTCRKNLPLSSALRHSLAISARHLGKRGFPDDVYFHHCEILIRDLENFHLFQNILPPGYEHSYVVQEAEIFGTVYCPNMVLIFNYDDNLPQFGLLHYIVKPLAVHEKAWFLLAELHTVGFCRHLHCYEVRESERWVLVEYNDLISFYPSQCRMGPDGNRHVTFRHML